MTTVPKYKNWQDFKSRNDRRPNKQKGDAFESPLVFIPKIVNFSEGGLFP